jgi:hypothetical protein
MVILTWSTSTDLDTPEQDISYIIYWANEEISEENASATNPTAFSTSTATTTITFSSLDYDSTYYFGIRAFDGLNYSSLATTSHSIPLPKITDLNAGTSAIRKAVDLFWTAPGAKSYLIKYAEKEIVENPVDESQTTWENASSVENLIIPKTYGEIESLTVENLIPDKIYYFAIRSINSANATSEISNSSKAKAISEFIDNGDGTVTDLYTGLIWVKDGGGSGSNNGEPLNWQGAKDFSDNLVLCKDKTFISTSSTSTSLCAEHNGMKYDDWRLPNFKELASIINYNKNSPVVDEKYFSNTLFSNYWTTSYKYIPGIAYAYDPVWKIRIVDFSNGTIKIISDKNILYYIRPVRGPDTQNVLPVTGLDEDQTGCNLDLQDNGDETITDLCTNLIWTQSNITGIGFNPWPAPGSETGVVWKKAIEVAESSNFAGYTDWRLPNVRELISIAGIASGGANFQWSSTQDYSNTNNRWFVNLSSNPGISSPEAKTMEYYVRLIREP